MADTVVTIGGDSSELQDAFKDASKAAGTMKVEAKKLTDQLKEVGDEADKAAGAFVEKFGGPGAIKAIAGIGGAVGIAKAGVEAFLDSSEALFKSYGDEGQKVWDETEKSLFAIKGAFAEAVLGGGDLNEMGARLKSIFEGTKAVVDGFLTPVKLLAQAFWGNSEASAAAAANIKDFNTAVELANTNAATMEEKLKTATEQMWALTGQTEKLTEARFNDFVAAQQLNIKELEALDYTQDAKIAASEALAMADRNRNKALEQAMKEHHRLDREGMARADQLFAEYQTKTFNDALARQQGSLSKERAAKKAHFQALIDEAKAYAEEQKALANKPKTGTGSKPAKEAEDHYKWVVETERGTLEEVTAAQAAAYQQAEMMAGAHSTRVYEILASELANIEALRQADYDNETRLMTEAAQRREAAALAKAQQEEIQRHKDAEAKNREAAEAQARYDAEIKRQQDADRAYADQKRAETAKLQADLYGLVVNNSAKMLAIDLQDKEKSKTAAQRATAAVVSGLGDMAMVKSGMAAAAGNFAEAAAFTTVGTLAYAAAAKLAPSEKTKTTAPAAVTRGASTSNVSYNLRVDAAFADGESVARRFAEMQQGAQRRGLI